MKLSNNASLFRGGALLSALAAALPVACCLGPVTAIFFAVAGTSSAAVGWALQPYQPYLSGIAAIFLAVSLYQHFRGRRSCQNNAKCAVDPQPRWRQILYWLMTVLTLGLILFPFLLPYLPYQLFSVQ